ncbi:AsmA family protein [Oxalobacteraceae bacterium R-40]|uniref:AsmA family protein n=1 Tax=Keguizhuia sedimenti TaxID=3064264 RepID=A0ABU1BM33_9BURK|nr:AsmA family protein [Oxalobacteraceae bacterium R-40]
MPKSVKYLVFGLLGLLGIVIVAGVIIAATFDPNDYKPYIIKTVQEKKQRTLTIPGEIKLTFFPKIGADLGKVSISEHQGKAEFASVNSAKVSLALIPLLSKTLVVDHVKIDGLNVHIKRFKDGSTNFDDLLSKEQDDQDGQVAFDIDGVSITDSRLLYEDLQKKQRLEISKLDLETGKIADKADSKVSLNAHVKSNSPAMDADIAWKSGVSFDLGKKQYAIKNTDASIKGMLAGFSDLVLTLAGDADIAAAEKRFALDGVKLALSGKRAAQQFDIKFNAPKLAMTDKGASGDKISGQVKLIEGARTVDAEFSAPSFEGSPQAFKLPALTLDATVKEGELDAKAKLTGTFSGNIDKMLFSSPQLKLALSGKKGATVIDGAMTTPLVVDLNSQIIEASSLNADLSLPNPGGGAMKLNAGGKAHADLGKKNASLTLKGKLDESTFDAKLGATNFSPMAYTFDIAIDRLNADRYKSRSADAQSGGAPEKTPEQADAAPLDLSGLRDLQANGSLRIGALTVNNIKTSNLRMDLKAGGGNINVNPLSANLYGGSTSGAVSATATKAPRISLRQTLAGVNVGPLLKDAIGKDPLEGRGNVDLNVTTEGGGLTQWKKNLNGTMKLALRDGAIRGVNVAQTVRNAKARIGAIKGNEPSQTGTGSANEKTDFSEMSGSFRVVNGVAHNDDLAIKSPLIRVGGAGTIDLGADRLDYLAKTTVVSTLQGQGGPELQALKGVTIPVRLSGPFSAIGWKIDFQGMATELAKQKIDEKKDEVKAKAQKELDKQKGKVQEQLLKGLFGK